VQFSMIFEAQMADPSPEHERQVLTDCVEQAVYAEEMGFDRVWAVEHHALRWYAHMSAPEVFLTWVAAKTSRIRIGHGVVCMPFNYNHPVRVGERAAMLDNLSGGRLDLGAGRGATLQEMALCGVDPGRTYAEVDEALRMLGRMWQQDTFEWHGNLLTVEPAPDRETHRVLPRPIQRPHPPFFLACTKRDTVALAAEYGIGALVLGFAGVDEVAALRTIYDDTIATRTGERFVSTEVNDHFSALCPTIVLDDADEALRVGARGQRFFAEAIAHWYGGGPPPAENTENDDNVAAIERDKELIVAKLHEANIPVSPNTTATFNIDHAYGTADRAIAYAKRLQEAGADEIMCLIQMGTVPQGACMETIRQWGEKVIPHFRNRQATRE
jgi:alkanesulfonate monooxygenase SsuD/methylene tetrahydromethanopterin reductase-like flavin-dependent oxidoreductase (luciferase family)